MELREYNLLRQGKNRMECLPSELVTLAHYRAGHRKPAKVSLLDRVIWAVIFLGAGYMTYHLAVMVLRP
jgi:hypothetical protein